MAEDGFHKGGLVNHVPRPLISAVDGDKLDQMNEGSLTVIVTVNDASRLDRRVAKMMNASVGVPQRLLGRDKSS